MGPVHVNAIVREFARGGLLAQVARNEVPNVVSEQGQTVVEATIALKESGLIASCGSGKWQITSAGLRLLARRELISFETLRRRPKYRSYLQRLATAERRREWQALRFDSYVSGRLLTFDGGVHAAPAALAYAIEYSLKAALTELRDGSVPQVILKCHDFPRLYRTCLEHGFLTDTFISEDFLEYAQHHFERRYPSGQRKYWTFGDSYLPTYDDCLVQIDRSLNGLYGSGE